MLFVRTPVDAGAPSLVLVTLSRQTFLASSRIFQDEPIGHEERRPRSSGCISTSIPLDSLAQGGAPPQGQAKAQFSSGALGTAEVEEIGLATSR